MFGTRNEEAGVRAEEGAGKVTNGVLTAKINESKRKKEEKKKIDNEMEREK